MKKVLKILGGIVLLIIAFVLVAGLFVSKDYHFQKDITINAPRDKVWIYVGSLHGMQQWNPFIEADPNIQVSYEGEDGKEGAVYNWKGNKEVGSGSQTITKISAPDRIETHLHFIEPFEGEADAFISLDEPAAGTTKATWSFDTRYKYPMNVMQLFMNMDEMMGTQYNKGLSKLKSLAESNPG